ncbi:MAG: NAD(P)-dependent oxidoreductase [bacterium]
MRLITGGSGFLGAALARLLLEKGLDVRVFDLKPSPALPPEVDFRRGDVRDPDAVADAVRGASHVYHLAALLPQRKAPRRLMRAVHVGGTENVLNACAEHGAAGMVFLSSSEVYGKMKVIPSPEDAPKKPLAEYGRNKLETESLCLRFAERHPLALSILRPPTLIGPGIFDEGIKMMMNQVRKGAPLPIIGAGKNRVQALDVGDCASAVFACGESPRAASEIFNARADDVPSLLEVTTALVKHAGSKSKIIKVPAALGVNALRLLNVFGLSPMRPEHFELLTRDHVMDTRKIKEKLGWAPRWSYLESVKEMYDWFVREAKKA